ncbi:MAG: PAC2 family protein [Desulfurococcaceae archaeon]
MKIIFFEGFDPSVLRGSTLITGFQGFGLVGYLSSRHIASQLGLRKVGFIRTRSFPETTAYADDYGVVYPFEIYYGEPERPGLKLTVLVNNATPTVRDRTDYAEAVARWAKEAGISRAILIGGLDPSLREGDERYKWIPMGGYSEKLQAPMLVNRHIIGPLALLIMFMDAYRVPGVAIFVYTELYKPDLRASATAVEIVGELLGLKIDAAKLLEGAQLIESLEAEREKLAKIVEGEVVGKKHQQMYI